MGERKHTPGPWFLEGNWDANSGKPLGGWVSSNPPAGMPVFSLEACVGTKDEIAANARLIAAAPDLLTALEAAVEYMAFQASPHGEPVPLERCRAAIAKATGAA